jgi:hypothetical protein
MVQDQVKPELSQARRTRRWRIAGVTLLLLGGIGAGVAYWYGMRSAAFMDDPSMQGFNRAEHRQMGMFFGKSGYLIDDLMEAFNHPGTQAIVIGVSALLVCGGCFFIASLPPFHRDPDFFKPTEPGQKTKS